MPIAKSFTLCDESHLQGKESGVEKWPDRVLQITKPYLNDDKMLRWIVVMGRPTKIATCE